MKKNETYHATVHNCSDPGNCTWKITGGEIKGNNTGNRITFVPNSDNVIITLTNQNGEMTSRPLIVQ